MGRTRRATLAGVGVVMIAAVSAQLQLALDRGRAILEERASEALGRTVHLGHVSLSLMRASLSADTLVIGDDPTFSRLPFLTARSVELRIAVMPLIMSRTLNVMGIAIEHPEVTLIRDPAGRWNYSSLETFAVSPGDTFIRSIALNDGRLVIGSTGSRECRIYDHVNVAASDVSPSSWWPVAVTAERPGGGSVRLDGWVGPPGRDPSRTPFAARLQLHGFHLGADGSQRTPRAFRASIDLDTTMVATGSEVRGNGTAILSNARFVNMGLPTPQAITVRFETMYDFRSPVQLAGTVQVGAAIARVRGSFPIGRERSAIDVTIAGQSMPAGDSASVLPALGVRLPRGARLANGTVAATLHVTGRTDRLVIAGQVSLYRAKLAGYDLRSIARMIAASDEASPGRAIDIERADARLRIAEDCVRFDGFDAVLPAVGHLIGAGTIDNRNNLDFRMVGALASRASDEAFPFLVRGTTDAPAFVPDASQLTRLFVERMTIGAARARLQSDFVPPEAAASACGVRQPMYACLRDHGSARD